ncbi:hypothetical protein MBLNU457_5261t1 [Dothideomycetes sp. NU457]
MGLERGHVISAGIAGFISWLLITAAVPSLRWIPYALVAGALISLLGVLFLVLTTSRSLKNGASQKPIRAIPAFITTGAWEQEKAALRVRSSYTKRRIYPRSKAVSDRIDQFLSLILRDFVTVWYKNISGRSLFQNEIDRAIRDAVLSIGGRLAGLDLIEIAVSRIVPIVTNHMQEFYTAERLVRGKNLTRDMTESEELDLAIAGKYKDGRLHKAASLAFSDTKLMQQAHIRTQIGKILPMVMSEEMQSSPAVMTLVREIVACAVLGPIILMVEDPDFWNQMIDNFGRALLQDRKSVRKLRAALDEHAPISPRGGAKSAEVPRLRPNDTERQFERFIRAIRQTATLSDARRFRSEVASQIRKESASAEQDPIYMRRLDAGRRILDQKIANLSAANGPNGRPKLPQQISSAALDTVSRLRQASLKEVLHKASGLSYFMEFMDRRQKMRLVQFWIIIDGFRNPLEEDTDEPGYTLQEQAHYSSADRMDIVQIKQSYLGLPELHVTQAGRKAVDAYLKAGKNANMQLYIDARRAILKAQTAVYEEMKEEHFEAFKRSDLFYKWLATEESSIPQSAETINPTDVHVRRSVELPRPSTLEPPRSPVVPSGVHKAREGDLRRAAMSATDLASKSKPASARDPDRRSVDEPAFRPLFDDDVEDERMTRSVPSLARIDSDNESFDASAHVVDAMQKELDDIVDRPDTLFNEPLAKSPVISESPRPSTDTARPSSTLRPNLASLGLVGGTTSGSVFADDLFADEQQKYLSDEKEDSDEDHKPLEADIHEAAPGDLGLKEAIEALNADISRLSNQDAIVDSLTKKAELTNNAAELRILRKSKQSLQREIRRKELQKQQYMIQESDNGLYGKAAVNIKSILVRKEEDGHEFAIYVIEVRRQAGDQMPAAKWTVTRRYSEFHELNKRLRARFDAVRNLDFPSRQTLFTLQKDFLQRRKVALEKFLRSLLLVPAICRSRELRAFLSQAAITTTTADGTKVDQGDFVTRIYNSVSDGMEEFLGNMPVLDQLTVAGQNLISAASAQINGNNLNGDLDSGLAHDPVTAAEAEAEINAFEDREAEPFVKPISDLFLEVFELQKGNSWLRGRAVVVVLHQLLGGTVERKVRETAKSFVQEASLVRYIDMVKDIMWPGGEMKKPSVPRTPAEKARTRKDAAVLLSTLLPDMSASVVGRANAQAASRKIVALLNNPRLNTHLTLTLFDEIVHIIFPELNAR